MRVRVCSDEVRLDRNEKFSIIPTSLSLSLPGLGAGVSGTAIISSSCSRLCFFTDSSERWDENLADVRCSTHSHIGLMPNPAEDVQ